MLGALLALGVGGALYAMFVLEPGEAAPETTADSRVVATDAAPAPDAKNAAPGAPTTKAHVADPDAAHVHGVVRLYRTKAPVEGLALTLKSKQSGDLTSTTAKDGSFQFDEVPPGPGWELRGSREPYAPIAIPMDLAAKEDHDLDVLWLEAPASLTVIVFDLGGKALKGAQVDLFATARAGEVAANDANWWWDRRAWETRILAVTTNPKPTASAVCDADGKAVVPGLTPGTYRVRAASPGCATQTKGGVLLAPDAFPAPVRIVLGPGHKLEGSLTDDKGKPIPAANVIAAAGDNWNAGLDRWAATTTEKGAYSLDGLAAGRVTIYVERKGKPLLRIGDVGVPDTTRYDIRLRPGGTIRGTVTDEESKPVAGAEVRSAMQNSWSPMAATTDKDGKFEFADVPAGPIWYFRIDAKGYMPYPDPSAPSAGSGESLRENAVMVRDVVLRKGVAAELRVIGADTNAPIEGCEVALYVVRQWGDSSQPWKATTDKEGVAKFGGLVPGNYLVMLRAPGYVQEGMPPWFTNLLQSPDAMPKEWRLDIGGDGQLVKAEYKLTKGATVAGRVWDANKQPVAGARVTVQNARNEFPVFSDAEGKFKVDAVAPANRCVATASGPGGTRGTSDPFVVRPGQQVENIDVKLGASGRVTGSARTPDGKPLVGAMVRFVTGKLDDNNTWAFQQFQSAERWPIGPDGRFEISPVPEGNVTVRADAEGYLPAWKNDVVVHGNQDTGGVELILKNAVEISGRVEAQTGGPVAGAQIVAQYDGSGGRRGGNGFVAGLSGEPTAQTDADGKFTLKGLQEGGYSIWAQAPGYASGTRVQTKTGAGDVILRLATGMKISGVVKDESGGPVGGVPVRASKIQSGANEWWSWWGDAQVYTGPDGSFALTDVADGAYDLTVSAMWQWGREVNVEDTKLQGVNAGRDDVVITVKTGGIIEGTIVDHDGKAINTAWITAQFEAGNQDQRDWTSQRWSQSKSDGTFRIVGLKPGSYTLYAYGDFKMQVLKGVGSTTKDAKIQVEPGYAIWGRVVDQDGLSLAGWANFQVRKSGTENWEWMNVVQPGDGNFVVLGLEMGRYDIQVQSGGYAPLVTTNVTAGERELVIVLQKGLDMSGVVLDSLGNGASGASVQAWQLNPPQGTQPSTAYAQTDAQGNFKLTGLAAGNFRLVVRAPNLAPAVVPLAQAGSSGVKVSLEVGVSISGTVADESGAALSGVQVNVTLSSDDGVSVGSNAKSDGTFEIQHVPTNRKWRVQGWAWGNNSFWQLSAADQVESGATDVKVVAKPNR